jgi:hypothetical protein
MIAKGRFVSPFWTLALLRDSHLLYLYSKGLGYVMYK